MFMLVECDSRRKFSCLFQFIWTFSIIHHPRSFLSHRGSNLVHPYCWYLPLLKMENMFLETTFTQWEVSESNNGDGISSQCFPLDKFRTWYWAPLYGFLSTARIFHPSSLTMKSTKKQRWSNASSAIFIIESASMILELSLKFFGESCPSFSSSLLSEASYFWKSFE